MKFKFGYITLFLCWAVANSLFAQVEKPVKGTFALTNATIETVTKGTLTGTLLIRDGKIAALGSNVTVPAGATVIDCQGLTLYPGMIDGGTQLGLGEVGSISLTQDADEIGDITPHMEALTAVNPNATAIPVTRVEGVTTVLSVPQNGLLPGTASLINLVGYTPDQMYAGFKGVVLNFPTAGRRGFRDQRTDEELKKETEKALKKLNDIWDQAKFYNEVAMAAQKDASMKPPYNPEMARVAQVLNGEMMLLVEVNKASDIELAIKWTQEKKVPKVAFTGVAEGWRVADQLAKAGIPVITGPVQAMPTRTSDRYDKPYSNAGLMHKAGVKVAIRTDQTENVRNLPFHAGFAAAYGLGKEQALKAVTIVPAEIFGVADKLGSLEVGKNATLFASTGDPLETKTKIMHLFIDGYQIPLDSRHIQLYHEFLNRTPGVRK
ncbi:MAG: amidohydrolase family protein [Lewinellaceae bacterium]|nr:amidohydrolase family protein [Lewinellaceae bacterium]